jgi:hypothetical protein
MTLFTLLTCLLGLESASARGLWYGRARQNQFCTLKLPSETPSIICWLRLPAGSSSGAIKMWSYGSPAFTDSSAPRLLRQLKKVDSRSGVGGNPHSKVVGLAVSAGGQVLWSIGKASVSLWSTHSECRADLAPCATRACICWLHLSRP